MNAFAIFLIGTITIINALLLLSVPASVIYWWWFNRSFKNKSERVAFSDSYLWKPDLISRIQELALFVDAVVIFIITACYVGLKITGGLK